ncbi:hypothetical protein ACTVCO_09865 [Sanguibacter sp. A247]|uniref:hypothetical protein n=1 Tax=unclassified Sanguibacter TaxID=2645534 RepID=UPI003FD821BC
MRSFRARTSRSAALVCATALLLPLAACADDAPAPGAPPSTSSTTTPAPTAVADPAAPEAGTTAAGALAWLSSLERPAGLFTTVFDGTAYPDQGLTLDVLAAALASSDTALAADLSGTFTRDVLDAYAGDGASAGWAGSTAKAAVVLGAAGHELADDMGARLAEFLSDDGRLSDLGADDYSSTVSQAWGVLALVRPAALASDGGPARARSAVAYLVDQACEDGSFPAALEAEPCVGDADSTAFALSALTAFGASAAAEGDDAVAGPAVTEAAKTWLLEAALETDGGQAWRSADAPEANVNSTGVVIGALTDAGVAPETLAAARTWLAAQTVTVAGATALTFDGTTPDARASAQAIPALVGAGFVDLVEGTD